MTCWPNATSSMPIFRTCSTNRPKPGASRSPMSKSSALTSMRGRGQFTPWFAGTRAPRQTQCGRVWVNARKQAGTERRFIEPGRLDEAPSNPQYAADSARHVKQPDLLRLRAVESTDRLGGGLQQYLAAL